MNNMASYLWTAHNNSDPQKIKTIFFSCMSIVTKLKLHNTRSCVKSNECTFSEIPVGNISFVFMGFIYSDKNKKNNLNCCLMSKIFV